MRRDLIAFGGVSGLFVAACGGGGGGGGGAAAPAPGAPVQPPAPAPQFVDATRASGIEFLIGQTGWLLGRDALLEQASTGGAAAGDYDADGDIDLFITRGDVGPNLLYRNNGTGVFDEVAQAAGLAFTANGTGTYRHSGPMFADMDGDRDLDLFLGGLYGDPTLIFANNGDGTFTDVTAGSGIDALQARNSVAAAFGDYDLDGDLDLFIAHWGTVRDRGNPGDTEHLWRNDSSGGTIRFTGVSEPAGISPSILVDDVDFSFTPTFARIDDDLYPDLLSVADYDGTQFFINNRDATFTNVTDDLVLTDEYGMGSAVGDYDGDGDLDWFVSSIMSPTSTGNRLYRNDDGEFVNGTSGLGVRDGGWGWGACFIDFDNDGDLDIYQTNGWSMEDDLGDFSTDRTRAFKGSGGGRFRDDAGALGLDDTEEGRGVVCADFDNDGDVDIFQLHRGSPVSATMWRNDANGANHLAVRLNGAAPNTEAVGARIHVTVGAKTQMREIVIGSNFVSQNPTIQIFGLGNAAQADEVRVDWHDGATTSHGSAAAGQTLVLDHPGL